MDLGEAFVGSGANAAHVNTVVGLHDGPVGQAWATALATPSEGHTPFVVVVHPGLPVQPYTLFVNKATIRDEAHARMTWGPAQAGVAVGVTDAITEGFIADPPKRVAIAAVWVDPAADDADAVFSNNREATYQALAAGFRDEPTLSEVLLARDDAWNPYFRPR
jgi:5,6,7,8-tetrahydromethanopterin hydro-lyase